MVDFEFDGEFRSFNEGRAEFVSASIDLNNGNIVWARIIIASTSITGNDGTEEYYLSNDGGTTWEAVSLNTKHYFDSTGQDLRYRINAPTGMVIAIQDATGNDTPILIQRD